MEFILSSRIPFERAVVTKGMSKTSINVVLVTLDRVARAGKERVIEGMIRNLISPVPDGGRILSLRLKKSMIKSPLQKTGMLRPATETDDTTLSVMVSLLYAEIKPKKRPTGTAIIIAPKASLKVFGNFKRRSSNTFLFV